MIIYIQLLLPLGSLDNGLPSSVSACSRPRVHEPQEIECNKPSQSSTNLIVSGIDVYDNDIATLAPQTMVNDTIVNILFE